MSDLYWLTEEQMARLRPYFLKSHGKPRVDDRRVLSGIVFVNRNGLRWRDAPSDYGPHKTLYSSWKRWGEMGVFLRMMEGLAAADANPKTVMMDATYLKAHRTASSLREKTGSRAPDRSHQRRYEHGASRRDRRKRSPAQLLHDRWTGQRLYRFSRVAGRSAQGAMAARRPRLRRRLIQGCIAGQGHPAVHPRSEVPARAAQIRRAPIQAP